MIEEHFTSVRFHHFKAFREARSGNPELIPGPRGPDRGYFVDLKDVPIATENVFFDYDESQPASVRFRISNGNELLLIFPERGACYLLCQTKRRSITSTASFKSQY